MTRDVSVVLCQFDVPPDRAILIEDWQSADDEEGPGMFLCFGGHEEQTGSLVVYMPDETANRLLVALTEHAPRLTARTLDLLRHRLAERADEEAEAYRARLDSGPLPLVATQEEGQ